MADDGIFSTRIRKRVKYYFGVSNALSFTFASTFSRAVADYACLGYISILIQEKNPSVQTAALISTVFECVSLFLDSFFGRPSYRLMPYLITNLITDASFVAGMLMLWSIAPHWSSGIFDLAFALLAVGRTGQMLTFKFLFHYISLGDDIIDAKNVLDRIDVWRFPARCMGAIVGLGISQLKWKLIFKILSILRITGYVFLICGILNYKCQKNERNPGDTSNPSQDQINQSSQKCSLITQARQLLKLLLLYTPFLIYYVVQGAGNTLFYEQVEVLEEHIGRLFFNLRPQSCLFAIQEGTSLMTKLLMEILTVTKLWKESERWQCAKLILGMFVCFCCCMCSWYVKSQRLDSKLITNYLWMVPQFVLLGIAKVLVEDGMNDVFFSHLKISMHLWASSFFCFVKGLGASLGVVFIIVFGKWIGERCFDKYYFLLAMLTILAILFFMCLWIYAPKIKPKKDDKEDPKKDEKEGTELRQLEEGKNYLSRSHSPHPTESPDESTSKSSSNSDSSDVKRSSSYPNQPSNLAANVHYKRLYTHPKTKYEGITHQSSALSNLRPRLVAKSIQESSDGCLEMN